MKSLAILPLPTKFLPFLTNAALKRTYHGSCRFGLKTRLSLALGDGAKLQVRPGRWHTTSSVSTSPSTTTTPASPQNSKNIFLDNLGTLFLGGIATVIVWLVRSYLNSQARNKIRDRIEASAHADPIEIDDLRTANTELTTAQFLDIYSHVELSLHQRPDDDSSSDVVSDEVLLRYDEFVFRVREFMARTLGPAFTVQLGHLLDRVAASAMEKRGKSLATDTMPKLFWFTLLSMSLSSTPKDRIVALYSVLSQNNQKTPSLEDVTELVGYLQDTCQLVPDAQVVATSHQYPLQHYDVASPVQLVDRYQVQYKDETPEMNMSAEKLCDILTSNSICAWGECYKRSKRS